MDVARLARAEPTEALEVVGEAGEKGARKSEVTVSPKPPHEIGRDVVLHVVLERCDDVQGIALEKNEPRVWKDLAEERQESRVGGRREELRFSV